MKDNLARAGYSASLPSAVAEAGKNILELPFVWCAESQRVLRTAHVEDWDVVQNALDAKRGIIFLTPHLGCFEILAQKVSTRTPLTVMYRPPKQKALKPLVEGARARDTMGLAPATLSGVRTLLKKLRQGEPIGILPDQVPQEGEGVWADFFGKQAYTMTLPAKLHQMTGAPIILAYGERLPGGRGYTLHFVPFTGALEGTPEQQARAINAGMEALIARCPAQYFWSYNRYKKPDDVEAPPEAPATAQEGSR